MSIYTVTLHHPHASAALRQAAETRYREALEAALGGTHGVLMSWHAWQTAEHLLGELPQGRWRVARRWLVVADAARRAALADMDNVDDAYFEVEVQPAERAAHTSGPAPRSRAVAP